jgi:WD40 repeat protein
MCHLCRNIRIYDERVGANKIAMLGKMTPQAPWERVRGLKFSRDGARLVSGGGGSAVRLWDLGQQACVQEWSLHDDSVWAVHGSDNLDTVYTGGRDGQVCPCLAM